MLIFIFLVFTWPMFKYNLEGTSRSNGRGNLATYEVRNHWLIKNNENIIYATPVIADFDFDDRCEIVIMSGKAGNYAKTIAYKLISPGGALVWKEYYQGEYSWHTPTLYDINGDSIPEIFTIFCGGNSDQFISCIDALADSFLWTKPIGTHKNNFGISPLVYNGKVFFITWDYEKMELYILNAYNGNLLFTLSRNWIGARFFPVEQPAVSIGEVDITDNCGPEIIAGLGDTLFVIREDTIKYKWRIPLIANSDDIIQKPAIDDIDGDGAKEIIISTSTSNKVYVFKYNEPSPLWSVTLPGWFVTSPATGDVDNDGLSDVVVSTNSNILAIKGIDGTELWNKRITQSNEFLYSTAPTLGDIDLDNKLEILIGGENENYFGKIWCCESDSGNIKWTFEDQSVLPYYISNQIALGDVDGDGLLEIVVADASCYGLVLDGTQSIEEKSPISTFIKVSPNPFFNLIKIEGNINTQCSILIYDRIGRVIKKFTGNKGYNEIYVPVSELSSGIYFVVVNGESKKIVKMVKIK